MTNNGQYQIHVVLPDLLFEPYSILSALLDTDFLSFSLSGVFYSLPVDHIHFLHFLRCLHFVLPTFVNLYESSYL